MAKQSETKPVTSLGGFVCPECRQILPAITPAFVAFFRGQTLECPGCRKALPSLWDLALETVAKDWTFGSVFQLAGARQTFARSKLKGDRVVTLDLRRWNIPKTAEILQLRYNALGPAEGPIVLPLRFETSSKVPPHLHYVYGATYGRRPIAPSGLMIAVTWIAPGPDEVSVHHLADAVKQFEAARYDGVPVPANVAVEAAISRALGEWVSAFCTKEEIGDFLTRGATYAHQLKVLMSIAADTLRVARLDASIRQRLDKLRQYRNDLGHQGRTGVHPKRPALTKDKAGEFLTAAIFGYHYAQYLNKAIERRRRRKQRS